MSSQRKAWNDAMRTAAGIHATAHSARRSDRHKKQQRREKARKGVDLGATSSLEEREYRAAIRVDALEEVTDLDQGDDQLEEEYDEEEEMASKGSKKGRGKKQTSKRKARKSAKNGPEAAIKRLKPRSLASILVEEASKKNGNVKDYIGAEAALPSNPKPVRKYCPVTGLLGIYQDPKSGIHYANLKALEQIQERLPPWMSLGGSATYSETIKSLKKS
mmetsp:Transcript_4916/g.7173  ORF Transcript_4916/g.7173 Transcript_4916/m.7173 type:complete len:218 (-) Transcript_4916:29-682(-)